ncbi:hypothetical protein BC628DRAFT_1365988, partial [Trametes gibbosa]
MSGAVRRAPQPVMFTHWACTAGCGGSPVRTLSRLSTDTSHRTGVRLAVLLGMPNGCPCFPTLLFDLARGVAAVASFWCQQRLFKFPAARVLKYRAITRTWHGDPSMLVVTHVPRPSSPLFMFLHPSHPLVPFLLGRCTSQKWRTTQRSLRCTGRGQNGNAYI